MIKIMADTHTHTIACDHAYSTLNENIMAAKRRGLEAIAMTEHSPSMPGAPSFLHFISIDAFPNTIDGIKIIKGIEVNINDYDGTLDFEEKWLKQLEWTIASMHTPNLTPSTVQEHTRGWLAVVENPLVDVIGHCGDERYRFDYHTVMKAVKANNKIVEINSHSFNVRPGSDANCAIVARICAELEIPVVASSDAHHAERIGEVEKSIKLLESIGFPERLILNADSERFFAAVEARKANKI